MFNPNPNLGEAYINAKQTGPLRLEFTFYSRKTEEIETKENTTNKKEYAKSLISSSLFYNNGVNQQFNILCINTWCFYIQFLI